MVKVKKDQLSFDDTIYTKPANNIAAKLVGDASAKPRVRGKAKTPLPESLQPFLPGLSRRGRPRSKNPIPATVRATESRKRRIEAGIKRIEILLAPEVAADLDLLSGHFRVPRVEIISRLVAKAAKRIRLSETLSGALSGRRSTS
jgi:hypothetical protein